MKAPRAQPTAPAGGIEFGKLFRWARFTVAGVFAVFVATTLFAVVTTLLTQYNAQVLANLVTGLSKVASGGAAADAPPGGKGSGLIDRLVPTDIETAAITFAVLGLALIGLQLANRVLSAWNDARMLERLQQALHDKLVALGMGYHGRHDLGENTTIVMQYTQGAQPMLRDVLAFPVVRGISLISALVFLFHNMSNVGDTPLLLQALLIGLLLTLPIGGWWLSQHLRAAFNEVRDRQIDLNNELVNSIAAPQEIQVMGAEKQRARAFAARLRSFVAAKITAAYRHEIANQFQNATPTLLQTAFLIYAVFFLLESGSGEIGAILAIYYFVPQAVAPIQEVIRFYTGLNVAWPNVQKVGAVLDAPLEIAPPVRNAKRDTSGAAVALDRVTDFYEPGKLVLDDISHTFPEGTVTAIVGRSGSGKSSILRLIARLRDPREGKILIGGVPVDALAPETLRRMVSVVSQFPLFIEGTVRDNFLLAAPDAGEEDMIAVCRETGLLPVLERLSPDAPLATPVSRTAGKGLSGGERRLLTIARALLGAPRILLLDEPTTGIDAMSLNTVMAAIEKAKAGRTTLLVDHNLDAVARLSDTICCLDGGRFVDVGSPADLMARPTLFSELVRSRERHTGEDNIEVVETVSLPKVEGLPRRDGGGRPGAPPGGAPGTMRPKGEAPADGPPGRMRAREGRPAPSAEPPQGTAGRPKAKS